MCPHLSDVASSLVVGFRLGHARHPSLLSLGRSMGPTGSGYKRSEEVIREEVIREEVIREEVIREEVIR